MSDTGARRAAAWDCRCSGLLGQKQIYPGRTETIATIRSVGQGKFPKRAADPAVRWRLYPPSGAISA